MTASKQIHGRYLADGFLLEAAGHLAEANNQLPRGRRLHDSDRVVLFTALATEAHINHAIETGLSGSTQEAARTLSIKRKLKLVPGLAEAMVDFDPGREPLQSLFSLVKRRNALVHAEPDIWEIRPKEPPSTGFTLQIPESTWGTPLPTAARWLLSLCVYLDRLADSGVAAWRDHAYLARELLTQRAALGAWEPQRDSSKLGVLAEHLVDADFDREQ